jgi:hypothetical protein
MSTFDDSKQEKLAAAVATPPSLPVFPLGPVRSSGGSFIRGSARSLFVAPAAVACLWAMSPRWRAIARQALHIFANSAGLKGTWGDEPRLNWCEQSVEINRIKIFYFDRQGPLEVFHIAIDTDSDDDDEGGGGLPSLPLGFFSPRAQRPSVGAMMVGETPRDARRPVAGVAPDGSLAHAAAVAALAGNEIRFLERAISSNARLWIDADAIFPAASNAGGDYFALEVLRRQVRTEEFAALTATLRDASSVAAATDVASKCEVLDVPYGTDALQAWVEASIRADWAPGRTWLTIDNRTRRKAARALSAFAGTCLIGTDLFIGERGALRVDIKVLSAGTDNARGSAVVNASAWSAISLGSNSDTAGEVQRIRCLHQMRVISLARHW